MARDAFDDHTAPMARPTRRHAANVDDFAEALEQLRATFADQAAHQFAPELDELPADVAERRLAVVAVLTSFEAWDQLALLGAAGRRRSLVEAPGALFA